MDDVAGQWLQRFGEHESLALSEIFNLVLHAAGCNYKIDEHVVEDPDQFTEKLKDIQEEYQAVRATHSSPRNHADYYIAKHIGIPPDRERPSSHYLQAQPGRFLPLAHSNTCRLSAPLR